MGERCHHVGVGCLDEFPGHLEFGGIAGRVDHNCAWVEELGHWMWFYPAGVDGFLGGFGRDDEVHAAVGVDVGELAADHRFGGVERRDGCGDEGSRSGHRDPGGCFGDVGEGEAPGCKLGDEFGDRLGVDLGVGRGIVGAGSWPGPALQASFGHGVAGSRSWWSASYQRVFQSSSSVKIWRRSEPRSVSR